jgi:glycosyltransferase involved in cell wall biosynthesis
MVEAMAAGLPVAAADTPVNREVCGEAGSYFRTYDPEDCAKTAIDILDAPEEKSRRSNTSTTRAAHFSWQRYAGELVAIFHDTAQQRA